MINFEFNRDPSSFWSNAVLVEFSHYLIGNIETLKINNSNL